MEKKKEGLEKKEETLSKKEEELNKKEEEMRKHEEEMDIKENEVGPGVQRKEVRFPIDGPAQGNPTSGSYRMKERFVKRNPKGAGLKKWNEFKKEMKDAADERRKMKEVSME